MNTATIDAATTAVPVVPDIPLIIKVDLIIIIITIIIATQEKTVQDPLIMIPTTTSNQYLPKQKT
jgi:hypothetical protein